MGEKPDFEDMLTRLRADQESMPWSERLQLAASLADVLATEPRSDTVWAFVHLLAGDPKPEVRKEIAELLCFLPEDEFAKVAARLSGDSSFFVQKAVQRAMDRRRKGARSAQRTRRTLDQLEAQLAVIEKHHGKLEAARDR